MVLWVCGWLVGSRWDGELWSQGMPWQLGDSLLSQDESATVVSAVFWQLTGSLLSHNQPAIVVSAMPWQLTDSLLSQNQSVNCRIRDACNSKCTGIFDRWDTEWWVSGVLHMWVGLTLTIDWFPAIAKPISQLSYPRCLQFQVYRDIDR